jgi:NAD(P)-dependent dehydrogenase (short-subunit alcohol dehydrogenase family)
MEIQHRGALVTGGASGICRATVVALAQRGASVVIVDTDEPGARQTIELAGAGDRVWFRACDVTDGGDLEAAVDGAAGRLGRLDIVANVAGVGGGDLFADEAGDWRRVIAVNLTAVLDSTRLAVRAMRRDGKGGAIVNVASLLGLLPMAEVAPYCAAKAGVVHFTRSLADLAAESGIRVNAVCPEMVDTPMASSMWSAELVAAERAAGNVLTPEDVAAAVLDLVEDDSRAGAIMSLTSADGAALVD